jgi:hypothetical protein
MERAMVEAAQELPMVGDWLAFDGGTDSRHGLGAGL